MIYKFLFYRFLLWVDEKINHRIFENKKFCEWINKKYNRSLMDLFDYVRVKSVCENKLNLSTLGMGRGKIFSFYEYGEEKLILRWELEDLFYNNRKLFEKYIVVLSGGHACHFKLLKNKTDILWGINEKFIYITVAFAKK